MRRSLVWKLILAFMLIALTTAGLVALFVQLSSVERLNNLIIDQQRTSLEETLAEYYQANGSWAGVSAYLDEQRASAFNTVQAQTTPQQSDPEPPRFPQDRHRLFALADARGVVVIPNQPEYPAGAVVSAAALKSGTPVMVNGAQVGTILTSTRLPNLRPEEYLFLRRTYQALIFAVLGAMLAALLLGFFLARTLTRPLHSLTAAAQQLARGELDEQVQVNTHDEIGQLAEAFNRMSAEVTRVNRLRRQMTADIAHDLRTPLTVVAGYIESMRDGVLQPTPERLALIYHEIERLQNLVGDLRMLSQADAGELTLHPVALEPRALLERTAALFQHRSQQQSVALRVKTDPQTPLIRVDEDRMIQVFSNLISNALRYTPAGGEIALAAEQFDGHVRLTVRDTGTGIAEDELPHIFERFHKSDPARTGDDGGSGLGLAIARALVEAQGGAISAESHQGAGTIIYMDFPVQEA